MFIKLTRSTLRRRVAMLFGTAALATAGLAGSMAGTAQAQTYQTGWCAQYGYYGYENLSAEWLGPETAETVVGCLINSERLAAGLPELTVNDRLRSGSYSLAEAAVATKWWGEGNPHVNPDTQAGMGVNQAIESRIKETGYCPNPRSWENGENAVYGLRFGENDWWNSSPRYAVDKWMASPDHHAKILKANFTETGVGVALGAADRQGAVGGAAFVQEFGTCTE